MKCPIDGTELVMSERHGIEIDYCPQCRGVWLDRGELDKILERAATQSQPQQPYDTQRAPQPAYEDRRYRDQRSDPRYGDRPQKKRRESFLDDIFDFG
jgi:Zn-finger nucleic acid-binding protein